MHRAGDQVCVLDGPDKGRTLQISSVRMFATDNGYYLRGGAGLYRPEQVRLARGRAEGNPCGSECVHEHLPVCDHCLGQCMHGL